MADLCKTAASGKPALPRLIPPDALGSRATARNGTGGKHILPNRHPARDLTQHTEAPDRTLLRRDQQRRRAAIPPAAAKHAARRVARYLWGLPELARARRIAVYAAVGGELSCEPFAREAWRRGRRLYLPILAGRALRFGPYDPRGQLVPNRFGIGEPSAGPQVSARALDVVLAPLVAFDATGQRLGMGGGYYDRTLRRRSASRRWRRPLVIGIAHACQQVARIDGRAWDVPLDAVVTDRVVKKFAR